MAFSAALLVAVALVLSRPMRAVHESDGAIAAPARSADAEALPVLQHLRIPLCICTVLAGWTILGGVFGVVVGLVAAVWSWQAVSRLESPDTIRRRQELERDLPTAVYLLGACLTAGAAMTSALAIVGAAMPGAVGDELALLHRRLQWGVDPASVWRSVDGPLEPLGRSMARAHETGASVTRAVDRLAAELRSETSARAEARARTIEVRSAAPLGICFLPAFVLLGVVPMAAGIFSSMAVFG